MSTIELLPSLRQVTDERYRQVDVPVAGGAMRVGVWEPADARTAEGDGDVRTFVAIHGITSSHVSFAALAAALPEARLIAPDLRGRGRSRDLPAPYGMARHADDVAAVLDHLGVAAATAVGHSMGAFVALVLGHRHRERVRALHLVDGGMPLLPPEGVAPEDLASATLGPAAERLTRTFPSRAAYREFWSQHPAVGAEWTDLTSAYVDYDLVGEEPRLRPATRPEALQEDIRELIDGADVHRALDGLAHPTTWYVAPRGLMDEVPPLYPEAALERWTTTYPQLHLVRVEGVNHYTIVLHDRGVQQLLPHLGGNHS